MRSTSLIVFICISFSCFSQPYIDIVHVRHVVAPHAGLSGDTNFARLHYSSAGINLPLRFRNKKDALLLAPYIERWSSMEQGVVHSHYGWGLPVTLVKAVDPRWTIFPTIIMRRNNNSLGASGDYQLGGAMVAAYKKSEKLSYRFGLYANGEFFGLFVIPLAGIDWKINSNTSVFGILPGNLVLEHKINEHMYAGGNFRAITNSYGSSSNYWRIDENQLGAYLDTYITKNAVVNLEAGHSIMRRIRTGSRKQHRTDWNVDDNFYIKMMLAWRVRL